MYQCVNAVAMVVFNRPDNAKKVFDQVRKAQPPRLYIIADGARNEQDVPKIEQTRAVFDPIDWECEVYRIFSDFNLGCKKRVITGISEVFMREEQAIILEDDCVPTEEFFRFQDWALDYFKSNDHVAIVSGSNLLDYRHPQECRNGFSQYINCWGWGTWKRVWDRYDSFLSIQEVNRDFDGVISRAHLSTMQKRYWKYIFRHSIYTRTIWDFYMQYFFFKYQWRSVYPAKNLILNIGFGNDSTHMKKQPQYIQHSSPQERPDVMSLPVQPYRNDGVDSKRDASVIRVLYGYSVRSTVKIYIGNLLRYLGLRK